MSLNTIRQMLAKYRASSSTLLKRLDSIGDQLDAVAKEVAGFSGNGVATRRRRGRGRARMARVAAAPRATRKGKRMRGGRRAKGQDLATFITRVLGGASKPMGIAEITAGVKKTGYRSSSPSFAKIVGMRLSGSKQFKRAGRGMYQLAK